MRASESPLESYKSKQILFLLTLCLSFSEFIALTKPCLRFDIFTFRAGKVTDHFWNTIKQIWGELIVEKSLSDRKIVPKRKKKPRSTVHVGCSNHFCPSSGTTEKNVHSTHLLEVLEKMLLLFQTRKLHMHHIRMQNILA